MNKRKRIAAVEYKECFHFVLLWDEDTEEYYCGGCQHRAEVKIAKHK